MTHHTWSSISVLKDALQLLLYIWCLPVLLIWSDYFEFTTIRMERNGMNNITQPQCHCITVVLSVLVIRQLCNGLWDVVVIIRPVSRYVSNTAKTYQGVPSLYTLCLLYPWGGLSWIMRIRRNDKVEDPSRPWVVEKNGEYKYYGNFDWYNCLFLIIPVLSEHAPGAQPTVSSGGTSWKVKRYMSGNYYNQKGIIRIDPDQLL